MKRENATATAIAVLLLLLALPGHAWALQSHGEPEGIYVHQMAHVLFMGSLIYLYWHTRRTPELASSGWKSLQKFCIIFACWNIVAFIGHEAYEALTTADFLHRNTLDETIAAPLTSAKVIYFLTTMDNLLFVPAVWALFVSLRTFYREALREKKS